MGFEAFKSAAPVSPRAANSEPDAVASAPQEPQGTSCVTPSGIEIAYEWAPRRLYRLRYHYNDWNEKCREKGYDAAVIENPSEWQEVPSVTTVLGVLDKSGPLTWWGMKVGIDGSKALHEEGYTLPLLSTDEIVKLLTERKLTVNHVKDKAADRGVNVHGALERWLEDGPPNPESWPEEERGYVAALAAFLRDIELGGVFDPQMELMVGSLEHQYAGRGDLWVSLNDATTVISKGFKPVEIPSGRYYVDLKTRQKANFYDTNYLQCEAYEAAAIESGYAPTDHRGIVVVMPDGRYQFRLNQDWCFEDFLAVRKVYQVMNEREILRILREDLDATEVK